MQVAEDEWRPGFARRANNFAQVCNLAVSWKWRDGVTTWRIKDAVAVGTPDLTDGERSLLSAYCTYLNDDELRQSRAFVWPSSRLIALQLGCSENSVRDRRRSLERKGYIVRDYNRANRPADDRAIDISPLCARLGELEGNRKAALDANAALRDAWQSPIVNLGNYRAQAPNSRRLEQSQLNNKNSVERTDAPPARSRTRSQRDKPAEDRPGRDQSEKRPAPGRPIANGSPERARAAGRTQSDPSALAEMLRAELGMAVRVSPALGSVLGPEVLANPASAGTAALVELERLAAELLPEQHRNNEVTVRWGWSRHGVRTAAMLAIALGDPKVENPCRYFGRLACAEPGSSLDLRLNLARILRERGISPEAEPAAAALPSQVVAPPGADDPDWVSIAGELARRIRTGPFGAWFSQVGFHGISDGVLSISAPGTAADKIRREYLKDVCAAAQAVGHEVSRVMVSVSTRKAGTC